MRQPSLFGASPGASGTGERFFPDFEGWWVRARALLAGRRPPADIWWQPDDSAERPAASAPVSRRERAFADVARYASCHRSEDRWSLLYESLWRLHGGEPQLMELSADPLVVRLQRYAKAVRRDRHKMTAFVRFREVDDGEAQPRFVAWFEPDHHIVELTAPFFRRRFANMRWSILTPEKCVHWEGHGALWFSDGTDKSAAPAGDRLEDAWRVYYKSIFNPARLKTNAMRAEMPQKYWKNLPEARLIPQLIRDADRRVDEMARRRKEEDVLRCGPRPASPQSLLDDARLAAPPGSLRQLSLRAQSCRQCSLWQPATQVVFGEGPEDADIMVVGEQPGDREDLAGRPFVGPAGELLDRALREAAVARDSLYLTNAVKHFGFEARGRRRLHSKPTIESVRACTSWLRQEMTLVDPGLLVCLGVTAACAVLGEGVTLASVRGRLIPREGRNVLVTAHPAFVLRQRDQAASRREFRRLVGDLGLARQWRRAQAATRPSA